MADQKKKGRWAHLDQFQQTVSGEYVYTGAVYRSTLEPGERRKRYALLLLMGVALLALTVAGGCISAPGVGNCPYVLIPYVAMLVGMAFLCWALAQLIPSGKEVREYNWKASVEKIPRRANVTMVCCALSFLGEVVYLLLHREEGGLLRGVAFLAITLGAAALSFGIRCVTERLPWEKRGGMQSE